MVARNSTHYIILYDVFLGVVFELILLVEVLLISSYHHPWCISIGGHHVLHRRKHRDDIIDLEHNNNDIYSTVLTRRTRC